MGSSYCNLCSKAPNTTNDLRTVPDSKGTHVLLRCRGSCGLEDSMRWQMLMFTKCDLIVEHDFLIMNFCVILVRLVLYQSLLDKPRFRLQTDDF